MRNYLQNMPNNRYKTTPKRHFYPNLVQQKQIIPVNPLGKRNVAGQVKTHIHLINSKGEHVEITQTQQVLNLVNGALGKWSINKNIDTNSRKRRR